MSVRIARKGPGSAGQFAQPAPVGLKPGKPLEEAPKLVAPAVTLAPEYLASLRSQGEVEGYLVRLPGLQPYKWPAEQIGQLSRDPSYIDSRSNAMWPGRGSALVKTVPRFIHCLSKDAVPVSFICV